jgi:hypothetical protein
MEMENCGVPRTASQRCLTGLNWVWSIREEDFVLRVFQVRRGKNCRRVSFSEQCGREKSFRRWKNSVEVYRKDSLIDEVESLGLDDL